MIRGHTQKILGVPDDGAAVADGHAAERPGAIVGIVAAVHVAKGGGRHTLDRVQAGGGIDGRVAQDEDAAPPTPKVRRQVVAVQVTSAPWAGEQADDDQAGAPTKFSK